jgi:cytochrome c553
MDAATYRTLAFGEAGAVIARDEPGLEAALAGCARCHGLDGRGRGERVPVISGQSAAYIAASLEAFAEGWRPSGIMALAAAEVDPTLWPDLARHYAAQPPATMAGPEPAQADPERGRAIAERGIPERGVPACLGCHERDGANPIFPRLTGQHFPYLVRQLELFAAKTRGGTPYHHLMTTVAARLSPRDMRDVAAYLATTDMAGN